MSSQSTPNLQQTPLLDVTKDTSNTSTIYSYIQNQSFDALLDKICNHNKRDDDSSPPAPPVRDSSSLKSIKYGPGHEKFPSWPVPTAADTPQVLKGPPSGGSHRSKSWTDHTNYPKEKVITYTRPYMNRHHSSYTQQKLKTVMEKCEKLSHDTRIYEKVNNRHYMPNVDRDGKSIYDMDYIVPSPPERDIVTKPQLIQTNLEGYVRPYQDPIKVSHKENLKALHSQVTESGLEEFIGYNQNYGDFIVNKDKLNEEVVHQKQISYAQSEGYHSYVSSTDSTSTPFLDRLRRDSEVIVNRSQIGCWDNLSEKDNFNRQHEGRDSVVTTSSGSMSSSETLKWHGSISDVSVASSSCTHFVNSSNSSSISRQLIAHSAKVQTPQRHHSESILYMGTTEVSESGKNKEMLNNDTNQLKLFPVNTYTVQINEQINNVNCGIPVINNNRLEPIHSVTLSVTDRINELEKQHKYSYFDPNKKQKVPDSALKAIQKKALLSFYERHHNSNKSNSISWGSEPQLTQTTPCLMSFPTVSPSLPKLQLPSRRASSASDYTSTNSSNGSRRNSLTLNTTTDNICNQKSSVLKHQNSNSCGSLSTNLQGSIIISPSISLDQWIPERPPERPPKNPHLRTIFPDLFQDQRIPSPDLPLPSPPTVTENEVINNDEPLPPPPLDCETTSYWQHEFNKRIHESTSTSNYWLAESKNIHQTKIDTSPIKQTVGLPKQNKNKSIRSSIKTRPGGHIIQQVSSKPFGTIDSENINNLNQDRIMNFHDQRAYAEKCNTKYTSAQKFISNNNVAINQKSTNCSLAIAEQNKNELLRLPHHTLGIEEKIDSPPPLQPRQIHTNQKSMKDCLISPFDKQSSLDVMSRLSSPQEIDRDHECKSQFLSQSKVPYLASRQDKECILDPDLECDNYKQRMAPNGHTFISEALTESKKKTNLRETVWPLTLANNKEINSINKKNSTNLIRCLSMCEKTKTSTSHIKKKEKQPYQKEDMKKSILVLPDVLPINVKTHTTRSQCNNYKSYNNNNNNNIKSSSINLNLSLLNENRTNVKSPSQVSNKLLTKETPFYFLRAPYLSNSSLLVPTIDSYLDTNSLELIGNTVPPVHSHLNENISPAPFKQEFFQIKTSLSPNLSIQFSPLKASPTSSLGTSPPCMTPLNSPHCSPKTMLTPEISPRNSPKSDKSDSPKVIEGLQLIQRTEVVLRVNTSTTDASSQTEKEELPSTPLPLRRKLQEEIECEELSEDFLNHLLTSDRLKELFISGPERKKPTDYVYGLFKLDVPSRVRPLNTLLESWNNIQKNTPILAENSSISTITSDSRKISLSTLSSNNSAEGITSPLSSSSTYFTISEPKAKFLRRFKQNMDNCNVVKDTKDLNQKKEELVSRLDRKLQVLRSEELVVFEENKINNELGENVEAHVKRLARPHEAAKFRLHIEEVGKITSLLLSLSGRLARVENALMDISDDHPERCILESKRNKLLDQLEEAKKLKDSIDRRNINVSNILHKYLTTEEYTDYDHFINMKAKLIIDSKEIADKIKLGEEQLMALKETLFVTD